MCWRDSKRSGEYVELEGNRRFFVVSVELNGALRDWNGPLDLYGLEDYVDKWRADRRDDTVILVVTESVTSQVSGFSTVTNIQVYDKDIPEEVGDSIVWTWVP